MKTLLKPTHTIISDTNRTINKSIERSKRNCCFQMNVRKHHKDHLANGCNHVSLVGGNRAVVMSAKEVSRQLGGDVEKKATVRSRRSRQHKRLLVIGTLGAMLIAISSMIYLINPLRVLSSSKLSLSEDSFLYDVWKEPPVEVNVRMYIFTVQNAEAFLAGREKLSLREMGPFTYKEVLVNKNATRNPNNTVTYVPSRDVFFRPELSCNVTLDTRVIVPNVPLIGITAMLAKSSMFTNLALMTLIKYLDSQPFLNLTVEEYLWGYEDPLLTLASTVAPTWISFPRFGLMDRMFDDGENLVTMNVNERVQHNAEGRVINPITIDQYNGSPGLRHWGYEDDDPTTHKSCNTLQGIATEGVLLHKNIHPNDTFLIYRKAFCRTIRLVFDKAGTLANSTVPAYWFRIPDNVFDNSNPDNSCFQSKKGPPLPWGLSDVTPCYYRFPAAVSFPHFLNADPQLLAGVDGLRPSEKDHSTYVVLQPDIGVPMEVHSRMQTNLVVGNTKYISRMKPFNNITLPLFWADLSMNGLPDELNGMIDLLLRKGPLMQSAAILALAVAGATLVLYTLAHYWLCLRQQLGGKQRFHIGRYTAVKVATRQS